LCNSCNRSKGEGRFCRLPHARAARARVKAFLARLSQPQPAA
jgi:hypothetical protein